MFRIKLLSGVNVLVTWYRHFGFSILVSENLSWFATYTSTFQSQLLGQNMGIGMMVSGNVDSPDPHPTPHFHLNFNLHRNHYPFSIIAQIIKNNSRLNLARVPAEAQDLQHVLKIIFSISVTASKHSVTQDQITSVSSLTHSPAQACCPTCGALCPCNALVSLRDILTAQPLSIWHKKSISMLLYASSPESALACRQLGNSLTWRGGSSVIRLLSETTRYLRLIIRC